MIQNMCKIKSIDILIAVARKGGVENVINIMTKYFIKQAIDVRVVQLVYEGDRWLENEDCFYYLLEGREGHTLQEFVGAYAEFIRINGSPDVILAEAWPYMCYVAKKAIINYGVEHTRIYFHLHAPLSEYERAGYGNASHLELADGHLIISKMIHKELEGIVSGKLIEVFNPIDFENIDKYLEFGDSINKRRDSNRKILFYVGRLSPEKGIETVIKAVSMVKDSWELHIVGDGEPINKESLYTLAKNMMLKENVDVFFYGWQKEPWKIAIEADYIIIASSYEGFSIIAVEALHLGIPVISTPVGIINEIVEPSITGYLFMYNDTEMLKLILSYISEGLFPNIDPSKCVEIVKPYESNCAMRDLLEKLCSDTINV